MSGYIVIGASLSEPHTSITAFAEVVCMLAAIYRKSIFKYFYEDRMSSAGSCCACDMRQCPGHCCVSERLLPECSVPRNEDDPS